MINPYKRDDVFECHYETHAKFRNKVSAYHVLKAKKCYPQGCLMFRWSCQRLDKGKRCVRRFNYVGRLCEGCTHYIDEKIHYQPRLCLSDLEYRRFNEQVREFDDWLAEIEQKPVAFRCRIDSIKPKFTKMIMGNRGQVRLNGYLGVARSGFFGWTEFEDIFFLSISPRQQERFRLAPGDVLEGQGTVVLDHGRVLLKKIWALELEERSGERTWSNSDALVAREVATRFSTQPEECLHCPHGALVDVTEKHHGQTEMHRELYCLEGIAESDQCYLLPRVRIDACQSAK